MTLNWYAIATKSRHEKAVAEQLWEREVECFLPLREVVSKWKDRRKKVQFPLFPGYLFIHVRLQERRLDILKVPSVVRIIGFDGQPAPIPEGEVTALKRLVFSTLPYDPYPYLAAGDRVEIVRGPLRGLHGILVEKKGAHQFVVTVDLIRKAVSCQIDACDVVKVR